MYRRRYTHVDELQYWWWLAYYRGVDPTWQGIRGELSGEEKPVMTWANRWLVGE